MAGLIPENILDDILSRVNIVELIAGYIPLKRAGRNFKALCPFHHEKTPSFMVSLDRQIYHCFGCSAGGNAFNFLMQYERLTFLEAVEVLAKKTGVTLPKIQKEDSEKNSFITQLYKINELTAQFYQNLLNSSAGLAAKNYLVKRGIKEETIKTMHLGFTQDKWDALINFLRAKGISISLLEKAGLVIAKQSGGYYDRFRNRIIFTIFDIKDRPLGFGARAIPLAETLNKDENLPKYINSPETPIYIKGKHLYGLNLAKDAIRDKDSAVVVEGYLDFIMPYQEGFQNIVASLGTALTLDQVRLLKRYTQNVVMVYDPDDAGELATLRTLDIFIEEEMNVKVVSLPSGFDPDLFVRNRGVNAFKEMVESAEGLLDYKLRILKSRYGTKDIEAKAKISQEMLLTINKFKNAVLKSEYTKKLAQELKIKEEALFQELKNIKDFKQYLEDASIVKKEFFNIHPTEKLLLKLMLEQKELIDYVKDKIHPEDFNDERVARLFSLLFDLNNEGKKIEPNILMNRLGDEKLLRLVCESSFALTQEEEPSNREEIVDDCVKRLKAINLDTRKKRLQEQIRLAEETKDEERLHNLKEEFFKLIKER
jgi:DNA primase